MEVLGHLVMANIIVVFPESHQVPAKAMPLSCPLSRPETGHDFRRHLVIPRISFPSQFILLGPWRTC